MPAELCHGRKAPSLRADYQRLAEFRYHLRRLLTFSEQAAGKAGLAPQQHQALLAIKGFSEPAMTAGALVERLGSSVTARSG